MTTAEIVHAYTVDLRSLDYIAGRMNTYALKVRDILEAEGVEIRKAGIPIQRQKGRAA